MTTVQTLEGTWTCACTSEHRPTIGRAWCFDCSEWCYQSALCVRGEAEQLREQVKYAQGGQYVAVMAENERLTERVADLEHVVEVLDEKNRELDAEVERLRGELVEASAEIVQGVAEVERLTAIIEGSAPLSPIGVQRAIAEENKRLRSIEVAARAFLKEKDTPTWLHADEYAARTEADLRAALGGEP
jgi:chromosome segregation ATPase